MNKLVIWKMKAMTHNFCHFPSLGGKEIDCKLQTFIVSHLSFLHDNFQTRFEDLLQMSIPPFANFLHTLTMEDVIYQVLLIQINIKFLPDTPVFSGLTFDLPKRPHIIMQQYEVINIVVTTNRI